MTLLREDGDLAQAPIAALLIEALNQRATGVLAIRHAGAVSRVFLRAGIPVGAQTYAAFKPLGQVLLAAGLIDVDALASSLDEMARSRRPQGEVLVARGAVTREQVERALSEQQAGYLAVVAGIGEGTYGFEAGAVPDWTAGVRIAPLRAIVQALEQPQAASLVESAIGPAGAPLALASGYAELAGAFGWSDAEAALIARLRTLPALDAFFSDPAVPAGRARAILAALLLLGLAAGPGSAEAVGENVVPELLELASEDLVLEAEEAKPPRPVGEEERQRRQRLLQRALHNMGVAPISAPHRPAAAPVAAPAPAPRPVPGAPAEPPPSATSSEQELRAALEATIARARDPDPFVRLGLARTATREEVRNAYFQFAKRFHPDRFHSPAFADVQAKVQDLFNALNQAYQLLSDDRRRAELAGADRAAPDASAALDFQKAEACLRTRDLKRARGFYEAAARADERAEHLAALAWLLATEGDAADLVRAKQLLGQALRDPRSTRAAFVAAMLARRDRNDVAAERHLRAVLAIDPRHADAQRELRDIEALRARRDRPRD